MPRYTSSTQRPPWGLVRRSRSVPTPPTRHATRHRIGLDEPDPFQPAGTQARRTANAHAWIMVMVTVLALVDIGLRWLRWDDAGYSPPAVVGLSVAAAVLTALGATYGGSTVFDYGFNVETAGDHPVWHRSESTSSRDTTPLRQASQGLRTRSRTASQVECSPPYDRAEQTSLIGARVILDALATMIRAGKLGHRYRPSAPTPGDRSRSEPGRDRNAAPVRSRHVPRSSLVQFRQCLAAGPGTCWGTPIRRERDEPHAHPRAPLPSQEDP